MLILSLVLKMIENAGKAWVLGYVEHYGLMLSSVVIMIFPLNLILLQYIHYSVKIH